MRQQPDRPVGRITHRDAQARADRLHQRQARGAVQIIAAPPFGQVAPIGRPQPAVLKDLIDFVQIQVQLRHAVAEAVRVRHVAPVRHAALIEGALGNHAAARDNGAARDWMPRTTSSALATPA
ncbi:hypothetical protein G6F35_017442 [Rhizopus arrhizus]|nr:hypothetical protein G6F35_017442 [Rhizopus arrhizus]